MDPLLPGAVHEVLEDWNPSVSTSDVSGREDDLASSIQRKLHEEHKYLDQSDVSVVSQRETPDIVIGEDIGICVFEKSTERRSILRRLTSIDGDYQHIFVVLSDGPTRRQQIEKEFSDDSNIRSEYYFCYPGDKENGDMNQGSSSYSGAIFIISVLSAVSVAIYVLFTWSSESVAPIPIDMAGIYVMIALVPALIIVRYASFPTE